MQQQNPPRVVIYPRPVYGRQPVQCAGECCTKCALIFFTIMFLLVGFIVTMVGHLAKPFWGPEDDWCDFCREDRLAAERNLKNCRIVGPIFLGIGAVLFFVSIFYCRVKKKDTTGEVLAEPTSGQTGTTTQGPNGTVMASAQNPPGSYGYQQSYGQTPAYPPGTGPYPSSNPPPPTGYSPYPMGTAYPPPTQYPYTSPQSGQGVQPYPAEMPPPPSYESTVGQNMSSPSAPPLE